MDVDEILNDTEYDEIVYNSDEEELDDVNIIPSYDIPDSVNFYKNYKNTLKQNITDPCLTKYEKTKVLSERAQQIDNGSIIYIPLTEKLTTSYSIALEEFRLKKIPFIICRPLPNSSGYEYWKLNDLLY